MGLILLHSSSLAEPATRKPPKRVELTPPKSTATAANVTMQKGNVVTIKARGEQEFEILWIQARNMEPTGWECALASGADRFIVSLAEIVSHGASISRDVAAAAAAFWEAKAVDYNRLQRRDEEQKRKREEAAQKQSKRRLPAVAHAASTPTLAAQQRAEAELLEQLC